MKTITKTITALALSLGMFGIAQAAPPGKEVSFKSTSKVEQISSMKPGDRYVLVCTACKSAMVGEIKSAEDAAKLCHHGGKIHCDGCKKDVTIKRVGPASKKHTVGTEVKYLNADGKECMMLIPMKKQ